MNTNYILSSKDKLTFLIKNSGIETWNELIKYVKNLPYERNSNRTDFGLVISEKKGSCSSKHALLKKVADLNKVEKVKLILGMYKMNQKNTPNIGNVLSVNSISFVPEAHCYLKIENERIDITSQQSDIRKIESEIIDEIEIEPEQVAEFKVEYHKAFLKRWISEGKIEMNFDEIWEIREKCITNLTERAF